MLKTKTRDKVGGGDVVPVCELLDEIRKQAPLWEYFGASLDHSVLALCFATFIAARSGDVLSIKKHSLKGTRKLQKSETQDSAE